MLRLTTNVTVSPASSARSSSAACAHVLDRLRPRLGEQRRQLVRRSARSPSRPRAIAPATRSRRIGAAPSRRPEPRRGMKLQYFVLIDVEHALGDPLGVDVLAGRRTAARSARRRPAARRLRTWCGDGNGCSGEMWSPLALRPPRSVAPAATSSRPPVGEVRRDLDADAGQQPPRLGDRGASCRRSSTGVAHVGQVELRAVADARCASTPATPPSAISAGSCAVVALVRDEVLEDHLLQVAVLGVHRGERLERRDALVLASRRCRRGSRS